MRGTLFAAMAAFVYSAGAQAQPALVLNRSKIQAVLKDGVTVVLLPVENTLDRPVPANVSLDWVDTKDQVLSSVRRTVTIARGSANLEAPFRLPESTIWLRLRYSLTPDLADPKAFGPQQGVAAISQIAGHVFEMKIGHIGFARGGATYSVHVQAVHPATRAPVLEVQWSASLKLHDRRLLPVRVLTSPEGLVEYTFEIPRGAASGPDDMAQLLVTGQDGDFVRSESEDIGMPNRYSAKLQTDKPIYQPGQAIHLRALVFDPDGRAAQGQKVTLRIEDEDGGRVHTTQLVSSRFGVVQDDWSLPANSSLGEYAITLEGEDESYSIARSAVRVSRYELPVFNVSAKPDRSAYLPDQAATVEIQGMYLFGKPVPRGQVKVVRVKSNTWNPKEQKYSAQDEPVAEGEADPAGVFFAHLDLGADHQDLEDRDRFKDLHYAAYYTDPSSGRTEQKKFDVRITREPIHVYVIRSNAGGPLPAPIYVSTFYADGRPAQTTVQFTAGTQTATARTNQYGVGKALLVLDSGRRAETIEVRAADSSGVSGNWTETIDSPVYDEKLRLETDRTIYRVGDSVHVRVTSPGVGGPGDSLVVLNAVKDERAFATRILRLINGKADATFPYQPEFHGLAGFAAWNGVTAESRNGYNIQASHAVIFPDAPDLQIAAAADKGTYRPGEKAALRMTVRSAGGAPVEAALGVAVVDQAVIERARTDSEYGHRIQFTCATCGPRDDPEISGVHLSDFVQLDPAKPIPDDLSLVAEALVAGASTYLVVNPGENLRNDQYDQFKPLLDAQKQQLQTALDKEYVGNADYPRDEAGLTKTLGQLWSSLRDPWGRAYTARFRVERDEDVMDIISSGPDQRSETDDDFSIGEIRRSYFAPMLRLMERILKSQRDYPANEAQFRDLLSANGIRLETLQDPWGTPYRSNVLTRGANRIVTLQSAGPDRKFDTSDDFAVGHFSGRYFKGESAAIARALEVAPRAPQTEEQFRQAVENAGIDLSAYRDAWGRPYVLASAISSQYTDRTSLSTVRVYQGPATIRRDVAPVTQRMITFLLRSAGPDGQPGNQDDFAVASFPVLLGEESADPQKSAPSPPAVLPRGTGIIAGTVVDPSGAVIAGCTVVLVELADGPEYEAVTGDDGTYHFAAVPAGSYSITADVQGFRHFVMQRVPVTDGRTTTVDIPLDVSSSAETVTVTAETALLQTESSRWDISVGSTGTPRVREYFPETLLWEPELLTDSQGRAKLEFALADTVTTWKIAVIASTLDGRVAEADTDLRAFKPFFVDFNPPTVLTSGDQVTLPVTVRNYLDRQQKVTVNLPSSGSTAARKLTVAPNSSANVAYSIRAVDAADTVHQQISATAGKQRDAIEKPIRVHPNGQEITQTIGDLVSGRASFSWTIPNNAIAGATRSEIRLYPSVLAVLLDSARAILETPYGCAEQSISAGYANLIALRYARAIGVQDPRIEKLALANIGLALDSMPGFQEADGGVRYWATGEPDAAVTAYALSFLLDSSHLRNVDPDQLTALVTWLEKHQAKDGQWELRRTTGETAERDDSLLTAVVARSLAAAKRAGVKVSDVTLAAAYHHLALYTDATAEPYTLALFTLAALDSGDDPRVRDAAARLVALAREEKGGLYWDLRTNTPFYGWGVAGRIETSGLAISALSAWRTRHPEEAGLGSVIRRGLVFLLRGRDRSGNWLSTQATTRTMQAIADAGAALGSFGGAGGSVDVRVNGRLSKVVPFPNDPRATDPILVDVSGSLVPGEDRVELTPSAGAETVLMQMTSTHWLPWTETQPQQSSELRLSVKFDRQAANAGDRIRCSVKAERVGFRGYGMMLAEIGLPPGAEVDRSSLESLLEDSSLGVNRYDVLPDRVVLYLWPASGGASFDFFLSARFPMLAKSAASRLYDYYNPSAMAEVAPVVFAIH